MAKTLDDLEKSRQIRTDVINKYGFVPTSVLEPDYSWGKSIIEYDKRKQQAVAKTKHEKMDYGDKADWGKSKEGPSKNELEKVFGMSSQNVRGKSGGLSTFPPGLARFIVDYYSEKGETILDPCAGHNSRMQVTYEMGRNYIGYDVSKEFMKFNREVESIITGKSDQALMFTPKETITLREQTSEKLVENDSSIDMIYTSPPYWDIEYYGEEPEQLGFGRTYTEFMSGIQKILDECHRVLKPERYCIFNINDFRKNGVYYPYHADIIDLMLTAKFKIHDIVIVKWKSAIGACLVGDSEILTIDGIKPIQDIRISDKIISHNGAICNVTRTFNRTTNKLFVMKIAKQRNELKITGEHPILAIQRQHLICKKDKHQPCNGYYDKTVCKRCNQPVETKPKWIKVDRLKVGDYVALQTRKDTKDIKFINIWDFIDHEKFKLQNNAYIVVKNAKPNSTKIHKRLYLNGDFLRLVGYYLAEGGIYINKTNDYAESLSFTFNKKETNYVADVQHLVKMIFGVRTTVYTPKKYNISTVKIHSRIMAEFFRSFAGVGFDKKFINKLLFLLPTKKQLDLLRGAFRGDGYANKQCISIGMSNKRLIQEIRNILLRFGYVFNYDYYVPKLSNKTTYRLSSASSVCSSLVWEIFGIKGIKKQDKSYIVYKDNIMLVRINKIHIIKQPHMVYNIEVKNDNSYIAESVICHNCFASQVEERKVTAKIHEYLIVGRKV